MVLLLEIDVSIYFPICPIPPQKIKIKCLQSRINLKLSNAETLIRGLDSGGAEQFSETVALQQIVDPYH